jgi:hypothetical protein
MARLWRANELVTRVLLAPVASLQCEACGEQTFIQTTVIHSFSTQQLIQPSPKAARFRPYGLRHDPLGPAARLSHELGAATDAIVAAKTQSCGTQKVRAKERKDPTRAHVTLN